MSKVKITTKLTHRFGKSCIVKGITVNFGADGIAEVESDQVELILDHDTITLLEGETMPASKVPINVGQEKAANKIIDGLKQKIEDLTAQIEELTIANASLTKDNIELNEQIADLNKEPEAENPFKDMDLPSCKELCANAEYPEKEWKSLKVTAIREYLLKKYNEDQSDKSEE